MSNPDEDIPVNKDPPPGSDLSISIALIIIIIMCAYLVLILIILMIRKLILAKGFCQDFHICGNAKGDAGLCECLLPCVEALDCKLPTLNSGLDACCPDTKLDVGSCLMCIPCGRDGESCCNFGGFDCVTGYTGEDADGINCVCFELRTRPPVENMSR